MRPARPSIFNRIENIVDLVANAFSIVGSIAILSLMLTTIIAVVWRYLLNNPIFGIEDFSILTLSVVAAAAIAYGARKDAHVSVDLITHFANKRVLHVVDVIMRVFVVGMTGFATYALTRQACGLEHACITENLSVEHRPFYYILAAGMAIYFLHSVLELVNSFFDQAQNSTEKEVE